MKIGVVGATGLVGGKLIHLLENTILPIEELRLIASNQSFGKELLFKKQKIKIQKISDKVFDNLDLVFFVTTNDITEKYVEIAIEKGVVVIDNSSIYRMKENVPLIVPEINLSTIKKEHRLIANPNCSTIQLVMVLNALKKIYSIKRVDVSTYQAVSGAGKEAINEFVDQIKNYGKSMLEPKILPVKDLKKHYKILNNSIPQIDKFSQNGYSKEEIKVIYESRKILDLEFSISCTAVRVPILNGHSESVTVTFSDDVDLNKIYSILSNSENIVVLDDLENQIYPIAEICQNRSEVFVGRIRKDLYSNQVLHLWIVADNLLKGAAANALQIAEKCYQEKIFGWC